MYHQLDGTNNLLSLRPTTAVTYKYDHTKENIYLDRIARLMHTDRATLDSYAKIKLWEDGPNYQKVVKYVNNSQCHPNIKLTVVNIHRVWQRNRNDKDLFHISNRKLLWHGTKRANIPQILKNGFQLPAHAGQMFGSGIYFADRISKSSNYSDVDVTFLLLCEVGLGKVYSCKKSHNDWKGAPAGFDSVKANGTYVPDWTDNERYFGAEIPFGRTAKCTKYTTHAVNYNEFIVYDPSRVLIRFLVEVNVEKVLTYTPLKLVIPKSVALKNKSDRSENSRTKTIPPNHIPASIYTSTSTLKRSIDVRSTATKTISSYPATGATQTTTKTFTRSVNVQSSAVSDSTIRCSNWVQQSYSAREKCPQNYSFGQQSSYSPSVSSATVYPQSNSVQQSYSARKEYPQNYAIGLKSSYSPSVSSAPVYPQSSSTRKETCTIL